MSKIIAVHAFNSVPRVAIFAEIDGDYTISYVMPNGEKDWDVTFKTQDEAQKFFEGELKRDSEWHPISTVPTGGQTIELKDSMGNVWGHGKWRGTPEHYSHYQKYYAEWRYARAS